MASCTTNCGIYNQTTAYIPLYYSYASYCDAANINDWSCKWCNEASNNFQTQNVITTDYLQAFIGIDMNENRIIIVYRGTHNYQDWFKDLEYKQIPYPNIPNAYVHEGFYNAYNEIKKSGLISSLQTLLSKYTNITNILITGHSMGGALSELCALDVINNKILSTDINIDIYTFGCPRWANKELAEYFNNLDTIQTKWRIVNKNDPVAIVPGKFLGKFGFFHTSTEILYTDYSNLQYFVCDGSGEDPKCGYSLWTEQKDAHLWYLNIHEDCGLNDGDKPFHESLSIGNPQQNDPNNDEQDSDEYGNNFRVTDTHWMLSLMLICIGCVIAVIYYLLVKMYHKRKGYKTIPEVEKEQRLKQNKKQKNIMKTHLLDDT